MSTCVRQQGRLVLTGLLIGVILSTGLLDRAFCAEAVEKEEPKTPLAGESFQTQVAGQPVNVAPRDRRHVVAANFGVQWIPNGPSFYEILPFGALFVWHNWDNGERRRFRGTFAGLFNDVQYNTGSPSGWELVFTFQNIVIPIGRSEYVEGQRITAVDIEWNMVYGGLGIAYRKPLPNGHQDNALEIDLTYEPGFLWFKRSKDTSPNFALPTDTYEGRVHLKVRTDLLDRNLMELPHLGFSAGGDVIYGHRESWQDWDRVAFPPPNAARERDYLAVSAYALVAGGVPFVKNNQRHRMIGEIHGGIGKNLDRFSAFRIPGRPTGYEWEAISRPIMPGVAFNELFPTRYGIVDLTYRYEALFFLYPYIRGTYGIVERPRFRPDGSIQYKMDSLPALSGGVISGAPWSSQIELNYSYNFGIFRDPGGTPSMGGHGFFIFWSKLLNG